MIRVGVDVGGTFTDFVAFNEETGRIWHLKTLTTPKNPVEGVMNAVEEGLKGEGIENVSVLVHATTLGTNMFLGQTSLKPPLTALITNRGFIDVIEIARQNRPSLYNPYYTKPKPLVPRNLRIGITGRMNHLGEELEPLDEDEVARKTGELCNKGVKVYAVSLLHSYANDSHERRVKEVITRTCPGSVVVLSSEVDPQPMEYERTSTTLVNALLKPLLGAYIEELRTSLSNRGFKGRLLLMQSNGGVTGPEAASRTPAAFVESGPSAGAIAVAYFSRIHRARKALGFDMGGTTAKASSIIDHEPEVTTMYEIGGEVHMGRQVRGSGYPVRYPYIDLAEVSAGGGTIAWVDPGGGLRVGPVSAGSDPGPACYGLGGSEPTITDANLVLGRLPEEIAGGGLRLRRDLAEKALERIARRLGLTVVEVAWSIVKISNTVMSKALRLVSVEKGHDPREFTMYAFGGAGPLHAVEIARDLGVPRVIIPPLPGVFSALGLLVTDYRHSLTRPVVRRAGEVEDSYLETLFEEMEAEANRILEGEGVPVDKRVMRRYVEAKYWGEGYTLQVPYRGTVKSTVEAFHEIHEARYGFSSRDEPVEIVVARVDAVGIVEKPKLEAERRTTGRSVKPVGARRVYFEEGWVEASVYRIASLGPGDTVEGPSIIEAPDSTIVLPPGSAGAMDSAGSIVITLG